MALEFSKVKLSTDDGKETTFLASGYAIGFDYIKDYTAAQNFFAQLDNETEVHFEVTRYLYGEREVVTASLPEIAYLSMRMKDDNDFLEKHCTHLEETKFTEIICKSNVFGFYCLEM